MAAWERKNVGFACAQLHIHSHTQIKILLSIFQQPIKYTMQNKIMPYLMVLCFCDVRSSPHPLHSLLQHNKHILSNKRDFLIHKLFQNIYQNHEMEIPIHLFVFACVDSFKAIYPFWQWQKTESEKNRNVGNRKMISWNLDCLSAGGTCVSWNDWNVAFTILCLSESRQKQKKGEGRKSIKYKCLSS